MTREATSNGPWRQLALLALAVAAGVALALHVVASARTEPPAPFDMLAAKAAFQRPPPAPIANPPLAELGRLLFWDPRLSASGRTSFVSCHQPWLGWATTETRSRSDSGEPTPRKSQPLIGIGYAADRPGGWDGRRASLRAHVKASLTVGAMSASKSGADPEAEAIMARLRAIPEYVAMFARALPDAPIDLDAVAQAVDAYARTLEPGVAPFDRWIWGDEDAISASAKRGFVLFNTKARCATCHTGWRFTDDGFHDIGLPTSDPGRGQHVKDVAAMQFAFKTPTLRSVALRPPYMHDASLTSLYDVVAHYESGGIDRPGRAIGPLTLNEPQRLDLIAFLQTLTGVREGEAPPRLPEME